MGWCDTTSAIVRHSDADVWIMAKGTPAFDFAATIPRERMYQVRSVPGVAWAECMYMGWTQWQRPDGRTTFVEMVGLDDGLVGGPGTWRTRQSTSCSSQTAVIVDALYAAQLGVDRLGQEVEICYRKAVIRGISRDVSHVYRRAVCVRFPGFGLSLRTTITAGRSDFRAGPSELPTSRPKNCEIASPRTCLPSTC